MNKFTFPLDTKGTNGFLENIYLYACRELFEITNSIIKWKRLKNDEIEEILLKIDGKIKLKFLKTYGFSNIKNVTRKIINK